MKFRLEVNHIYLCRDGITIRRIIRQHGAYYFCNKDGIFLANGRLVDRASKGYRLGIEHPLDLVKDITKLEQKRCIRIDNVTRGQIQHYQRPSDWFPYVSDITKKGKFDVLIKNYEKAPTVICSCKDVREAVNICMLLREQQNNDDDRYRRLPEKRSGKKHY